MPLVFAGLGNPGAKYAANRHNVGFMAVDAIARRHSFSPWSKKLQGLIAEGTLGGEKIILIKPQTFMNLSGQSVGEALRFYKLGPGALTVFYDEIDLAEGKLRIKTGGGAGGHNGIRSIDGHVGNAYRRVRIGVGHPGVKEMVQHHVLGDFGKTDRDWLDPLLDAVADNAAMIVKGDESGFMNKAALALQGKAGVEPEKPAPKQQSHIRQARPQQAPAKLPESGPMAAMLKKLFGNKD
ncbi:MULTISPECIES: aminoacyl-tRNA hydrolase [unclassified Mesorhizobium]|uniref:aminoacyl-tRNA hydrolase n=1 Tax=unclassified Mesorhizobium TaxID=325217 RepID=UPI0011291E3E|nr:MULTISPECIES: aminoacyl-tRNA hydrolase [unclassified Mesorhizobium]MBZ9699435.1 aminoacyl-tRNA hydrolase [Mesorhizobium sp. CO1-1-3]MBZ9945688.1 aminoacyl-tRNA hydrolase [Mesorhizobium sp. BR1-1-11]TPJ08131.1 aminoacyl-tRNA hydrolase [Mesorhizobium sp. B2-8-1]